MKHLCIDLETLGQKANAAILSLGAVFFDSEGLKESIYLVPSLKEQCKRRAVDAATLAWWMSQNDEAKAVFKESNGSFFSMNAFAGEFSSWVIGHGRPNKDLIVWSNGAGFDVPIVEHILDSCGVMVPWSFWNIRCYRTLKALFPIEKDVQKPLTRHHALQDAKFQAQCVSAFLKQHPEIVGNGATQNI